MSELFFHFSKMGQGYSCLSSYFIENLKAHEVAERIDTAIGAPPILVGKTRRKKIRTIPVSELRHRDPGQALHLFLVKGTDDTRILAHSATTLRANHDIIPLISGKRGQPSLGCLVASFISALWLLFAARPPAAVEQRSDVAG